MTLPEPPDVERLRAALAQLGDDPQWPEVDAERLFSALHGEVDAAERRAIVDELIRNPRAAAVWRLARELQPDDVPVPAPARTRPWAWMSLAATLALTIGAAWLIQPWRPEVPAYRSAEARSIASLLAEGAPLSRDRPQLRWTSIAGARYRVRVLTPDLDVLDESGDLDASTYTLPASVLQRVAPGGRVLWQVEARLGGTAAVVSPTFSTPVE